MNKFLPALLSLLAPLAAQAARQQAPVAEAPKATVKPAPAPATMRIPAPSLGFRARFEAEDATLMLDAWCGQQDKNGFAIVFGNITGATVKIAGLPLLLDPQAVLAIRPFDQVLEIAMPFQGPPCDLNLQAAALVSGEVLVSEIAVVEALENPELGGSK